jgi:hypothetical protein
LLPVIALVGALAAARPSEVALAPAQSGTTDFSHQYHVPPEWLTDREVARDCRGCHDFSDPDPTRRRPPAESCGLCHVFDSKKVVGRSYLGPDREDTIDHYVHREQDCISCHTPPDGLADIPKFMPVPAALSVGTCVQCHEDRDVDRERFDGAIADRIEARNARRVKRGEPEAQFRHEDHLTLEEMARPDACERCHVDLARSDATNLGEKQFDVASCSECHSVPFETELYLRPSKSAATFLHYYHLRGGALRENETLRDERCGACHVFEAASGGFRLHDRFQGAGGVQAGCTECHTDWQVEGHGEIDECQQCHAVEEGSLAGNANMSTNRPRVEIRRPRPVGFRMGDHPHPLVASPTGEAVPEDCGECHLARVPAIPSELEGRPFDHAAHLTSKRGELRESDCSACHMAIRSETFSKLDDQLATRDDERGSVVPIFDEAKCQECHAETFEAEWPASPTRSVLYFSHYDHLGRKFDCTTCHVEPVGDTAFEVRIPKDVATCSRCHGHGDEIVELTGKPKWAQSGGFKKSEADSCSSCHRVGVPARGAQVLAERRRVVRPPGTVERHDRGGKCSECHQVADADAGVLAFREDPVRELKARSIEKAHGSAFHKWKTIRPGPFFSDGEFEDGTPALRCIDCHWQSQRRQWAQNKTYFEREPYAGKTNREIRAEFGNVDIDTFPGFRGHEDLLR